MQASEQFRAEFYLKEVCLSFFNELLPPDSAATGLVTSMRLISSVRP